MLRTARAALDAFHSSLLTSLTFGLASIVLTEPVAAKPLAAWVELIGPNGEASIRAIVSQKSPCPALQSGNDSLQMRVRAEPGPSTLAKKAAEFPVRVCEVKAPKGKTSVFLEGEAIPLPNAEIRRIVILGDTGCRINKDRTQNCDPRMALSACGKPGRSDSSGFGDPCRRLSVSGEVLPGARRCLP